MRRIGPQEAASYRATAERLREEMIAASAASQARTGAYRKYSAPPAVKAEATWAYWLWYRIR
jgi:hypothetical protein